MNNQQDRDKASPKREPYVPPAILESAEFETLALACGKTSGVYECEEYTGLTDS